MSDGLTLEMLDRLQALAEPYRLRPILGEKLIAAGETQYIEFGVDEGIQIVPINPDGEYYQCQISQEQMNDIERLING